MSEDEDPFENLGEPEDREGDPFERLGEADEPERADETPERGAATESGASGTDGDSGSDTGFEEEFIQRDPTPGDPDMEMDMDPDQGPDPDSKDDPFSGMDDRDGDPFGSGESAFEAVEVDSVDEDEVWASLGQDASTRTRGAKRYAEVSKHRFCEQCEFFSEPPAAHCTHDEAEIVEYLDMETVRLLNCPVVAEQREIENDE